MFSLKTMLTAAALSTLVPAFAQAAVITGPSDPNFHQSFQGASAATFASLGLTVGTGENDLKVNTGTFTDPTGLIFGTIVKMPNAAGSGTTYNKLSMAYTTYGSTAASANARDYQWLQNNGTNASTNPAYDKPWLGHIWDLGGQANQAVVFPIVDHDPMPQEAVEYTVYLSDNPNSTNLADWHRAVLDTVYLQGWEPDNISLADGFTTVWKLPGGQTFRYVSVQAIGSGALQPIYGTEDEIDAVAGLTAKGETVANVPAPMALPLLAFGLAGLTAMRRRA